MLRTLTAVTYLLISSNGWADEGHQHEASLHQNLIRECYQFFEDAKKDENVSLKYGIEAINGLLSELKYARVITSNQLGFHSVYFSSDLVEYQTEMLFLKSYVEEVNGVRRLDGIPLKSCHFSRARNRMFYGAWIPLNYYFVEKSLIPKSMPQDEGERCAQQLKELDFTSWPVYIFHYKRARDGNRWEFLKFRIEELDHDKILGFNS